MRKNYILTLKKETFCLVFFITTLLNINVSAQVLLNENFDYALGDLYTQGPWVTYGTTTANPIELIEEPLFYPGYQELPKGKSVMLKDLTTSQKLVARFTESGQGINTDAIYYSALINVKEAKTVANFILSFVQKPGADTDVGDGKSGTEFAKLFIKKDENEDNFLIGVDRGMLTPVLASEKCKLNTTYLIVVKYQFVDGITNDKVSLYINPTNIEPTIPSASYDNTSGSEVNTARGIQGIQLRQGATSSKASPIVVIDQLRVATTFGALFGVTEPENTPIITITPKTIGFNDIYVGKTYTKTINIKGTNLKSDIHLGGMNSSEVITPSMTILKEDAESADGFNLTVKVTPINIDNYMDEITFSSEGASIQKLLIFWTAKELVEVKTLKELTNKNPDNYETYLYTGEATISFIDNKSYYIEDETGGFRINDAYSEFTLNIGDKINNFIITIENSFGIFGLPIQNSPIDIISSNNAIIPKIVTLNDLQLNPKEYFNQLVRVKNVTFPANGGEEVTATMINPTITDGTGSGNMRIFKTTNIIGTSLPTSAIDLVGISTSEAVAIIAPRSIDDLINNDTPQASLTVNAETLTIFSARTGEEHKQTIQYTSKSLPSFGSAKIMGEGEGSFFINNTMLMKNGTYDIIITFKPKKEGTFTERIEFSANGIETFYLTLNGKSTQGSDTDKEGDDLPLSTDNPNSLLIEDFSSITKNKPISINGWKNIAIKGERAWWGYEFAEDNEKTAKVTAYDSTVESGSGTTCEMLLVTPALDFITSESKIFTFRIMGELLRETQEDLLEVCYIDMINGELYIEPINLYIPTNADHNKEWMEYHINLEGSAIADIFFIGFRFKSIRGIDNAATYFIDDVTYGRTDIPQLFTPTPAISFETIVNNDFITEAIHINTQNTTEVVSLSIGGANRSKFELTNNTLPKEGGTFNIKFNSKDIGVHEAYIKVSSRGAADLYIPVSVNNKSQETGLESIISNYISDIMIYDTNGRLLTEFIQSNNYDNVINSLPNGTYILNIKNKQGLYSIKVAKP